MSFYDNVTLPAWQSKLSGDISP